MEITTTSVSLRTTGGTHVVDVTRQVEEKLAETGLKEGQVTLFVPGSTAGLTTVEYEPGLVQDLQEFFERILPRSQSYHHNRRWEDGNGHSHVRASLLKPSLTIPFARGQLVLGTWQQIVFVDFDIRARQRQVIIQFIGK